MVSTCIYIFFSKFSKYNNILKISMYIYIYILMCFDDCNNLNFSLIKCLILT